MCKNEKSPKTEKSVQLYKNDQKKENILKWKSQVRNRMIIYKWINISKCVKICLRIKKVLKPKNWSIYKK